MIKDFDEINIYPEYPKADIVEMFANYVLDNSVNESRIVTLKRLIILGDKQYHTHTQPNSKLKERIQNWLINNWIENIKEYPDSIVLIAYGFALEKIIFEKALSLIQEDQKGKWLEILKHSDKFYINPWWDLKIKKNSK